MGRVFVEHLTGKAYCCKYCRTHLAKVDELLSKVGLQNTHRCGMKACHPSKPAFCAMSTSSSSPKRMTENNAGLTQVRGYIQA